MTIRLPRPAVSLLAAGLVLACGPSTAPASSDAEECPTVQVRLTASPSSGGSKGDPLRRGEIFRILQGGARIEDRSLSDHLWRVAGSLALREWNPPTVTIRVVIADIGTGD